MIHFFHRLFNVHCDKCREEELIRAQKPRCLVCEELRELLNIEKREKQKLLDSIIEFNHQNILDREAQRNRKEEKIDTDNLRPIQNPRLVPWYLRQQLLQNEDRARALVEERLRKDQEAINKLNKAETTTEKVDELEQELGISNG